MLLDRHRVAKLIELADLERRASGPERLIRDEDVALLIKAAYDDATDSARAEFLARVKQMPTSAWPWSAVQAMTPRGAGRSAANVAYAPAPGALAPAALVLLRGQVDTSDADPGNRIPDRGQPEGAAWEALHKALDLWDTATIKRWIAPQGWMTTGGTMAGQTSDGGGVQPSGGANNVGGQPGDQPGTQPPPPPPSPPFSWRHPAVLVAGATTLATIGVTLYALRQSRHRPAPLPVTAPPPVSSPATATAAPTTATPTPAPVPSPTATTAAKEST